MIFSDLTDDIWNEGKHNTGIDAETCDLSKLNFELVNKKPKDDILFSECQFKIQDAALM